jgi:hypothetical protein
MEGIATFETGRDDPFNCLISRPRYIAGANPERGYTPFLQPRISNLIPYRVVAQFMGDSVNLDRQFRVGTEEVEDVGSSGMLPTEFESPGALAEPLPEHDFRSRHDPTKSPRFPYGRFGSAKHGEVPSTMLRTVPLPETSSGRRLKLALHQRGEEAFVRGAEVGEGDAAHTRKGERVAASKADQRAGDTCKVSAMLKVEEIARG